jgi:hypothetical protein
MIAENFLGARRVDRPRSVLPKPLKSIRRQGGVARGVLDVAVSQIGLQRAGIVAVVRQLVATGVSKHMGMGFDAKIGRRRSPLDHPREAWCCQRRAALEIPTAPTITNIAPTVRLKVRPNHRFDVSAAELVLNERLIEQLFG